MMVWSLVISEMALDGCRALARQRGLYRDHDNGAERAINSNIVLAVDDCCDKYSQLRRMYRLWPRAGPPCTAIAVADRKAIIVSRIPSNRGVIRASDTQWVRHPAGYAADAEGKSSRCENQKNDADEQKR